MRRGEDRPGQAHPAPEDDRDRIEEQRGRILAAVLLTAIGIVFGETAWSAATRTGPRRPFRRSEARIGGSEVG